MRDRLKYAMDEYAKITANKKTLWLERPVIGASDEPAMIVMSEDIELYNKKLDGFKQRWEELCEQEQRLKTRMFGKLMYTSYSDLRVKELLEVVEKFMNEADKEKRVG